MINTREIQIFCKNIILRAPNKFLSVKNVDDVLYAVRGAYLSMQPRTFEKKTERPQIDKKSKEMFFKEISKLICDCFKNIPKDFNAWHANACNKVLKELNKLLENSGYYSVSYGKVQKIINITFKNLYLYDDADGFLSLFKVCHFAIDSANLKWYNSIAKKPVKKAWSNLNDIEYIEIQNEIKEYLLSQNKYSKEPFLAEFYIWADYQFK